MDKKENAHTTHPLDLPTAQRNALNAFVMKLKRRKVVGAFECAVGSANVLKNIIERCKFTTGQHLLEYVYAASRILIKAQPLELVIGNIARRVVDIVNEVVDSEDDDTAAVGESTNFSAPGGALDSIPEMKRIPTGSEKEFPLVRQPTILYEIAGPEKVKDSKIHEKMTQEVKAAIVAEIDELIEETTHCYSKISEFSPEHIHSDEIILTFGRSKTVFEFLKDATKKKKSRVVRKFTVIVAEGSPTYEGQLMASELAKEGIDCILISDAAVFGMMSHVNKVIIGAHAVFACGSILAQSGTYSLAASAHHHAVPVLVLCGMYKLCPRYASRSDTISEFKSPHELIPFKNEVMARASIENPAFDLVPSKHIALFVTNLGGHSPSYLYSMLAEVYSTKDSNYEYPELSDEALERSRDC